jgi:hypothetical protein
VRINVYGEELTEEIQLVRKPGTNDREFLGIRLMLKSPDDLHYIKNNEGVVFDDDRSAVTLWVPWTQAKGNDTQYLSRILERMADVIGRAKNTSLSV